MADGGLPADEACDLLNARRCDALERCGLLTGAGVATCIEVLGRTWCGPTTWPGHVAGGALRYDATMARECADAFLTHACADFATLPEACGKFLGPNVGLRAPCFDGFTECTDGVCRGAACPRTCQPRGLTGEVCALDADCRSTLFCRLSSTTPGVGQCQPWAQVGDACDMNTRCMQGLVCAQNQCQSPPTAGAACPLGFCDEQAQCVSSGDAGLCLARHGQGAQCLPGECLPGLVCDAVSGLCVPAVVDQAGLPCTQQQQCPAPTTCVGAQPASPGTCRAPLPRGTACARDSECVAQLACLPADGGRTCAARLPAGSRCSTDRWCQLDATCTGGQCQPLPGAGEPCSGACRVGTCAANARDGGQVCVPWLGPGATCGDDAQCESRRCVMGSCLTQCTP
jgi:hypothetical protein